MNGHRSAAAATNLVEAYELTVCDSEIPDEWRPWAATPREARDDCPLCRRRAQAAQRGRRTAPTGRAEPGPRKRIAICGECERVLFAGLLGQSAAHRA